MNETKILNKIKSMVEFKKREYTIASKNMAYDCQYFNFTELETKRTIREIEKYQLVIRELNDILESIKNMETTEKKEKFIGFEVLKNLRPITN